MVMPEFIVVILEGNVAVDVMDGDKDAVFEERDSADSGFSVVDGAEESVLDDREKVLAEKDVEVENTAGIRGSRPEEN